MSLHGRPPPRLHILLVEESRFNQTLAAGLLERMGQAVVIVGDGKEALAALEQEHFDLILMQVQMSEMDGCEVATVIRRTEEGEKKDIPIVGMTTDVELQMRCRLAGMNTCIARPVVVQELSNAITRLGHPYPTAGGVP